MGTRSYLFPIVLPASESVLPRFMLFVVIASLWGLVEGGDWSHFGLPPRLAVNRIVAAGPHVYAGTATAGVYCSTDSGDSWRPCSSGIGVPSNRYRVPINSIAVDPRDPKTVYAATETALYKTTTGGKNWTVLAREVSVAAIAIDPNNSNVIYGAAYPLPGYTEIEGIYKSTDGGTSWAPTGSLPFSYAVSSIAVDPSDSRIVYVGMVAPWEELGAVCRSDDGGSTWINVSQDISWTVSDLAVTPGVVFAATGRGVYKSTNRGQNWSRTGLQELSLVVVAGKKNPLLLYAVTRWLEVNRSTDGGQSWTLQNQGIEYAPVNSLALDPANEDFVYAGRWMKSNLEFHGVYRSTNRATQWVASDQGLDAGRVTAIASSPGSDTVYAASKSGFLSSLDGGSTWTRRELPPLTGEITAMAVDPTASDTLFIGTDSIPSDGILKSTDGGATWTASTDGLPGPGVYYPDVLCLAINPLKPNQVFAGTSKGLYRSEDGGMSWGALPSVPWRQETPVHSLAFHPQDPNTAIAGTEDGLYRTTDGGVSWEDPDPKIINDLRWEAEVIRIDPQKPLTMYATSRGGLFKTTDGGASWKELRVGPEVQASCVDLDDRNAEVVYTASDRKIYRSDDGGASWVRLEPELPADALVERLALTGAEPPRVSVATLSGMFTLDRPSVISVQFFPQVGNGQVGNRKFRTNLTLTNFGNTTPVMLEFFDTSGSPMVLDLGHLGTASKFEFTMEMGESLSESTSGSGALKVGSARLTSNGKVGGTAVFSYDENGVTLYEAGVPATRGSCNFSMYLDSLGDRETGLAVVNVGDAAANVSLRLSSEDTVLTRSIGQFDPNFAPLHHLARYAWELFPEIRTRGIDRATLSVESDQPLAAITLRQKDNPNTPFPPDVPTMSTFPVLWDRPDRDTQDPFRFVTDLFFAQVGDGRAGAVQFTTDIVLVNVGPDEERVHLSFSDQKGMGWTVDLGPYGTGNSFYFDLESGEAVSLHTAGIGDLRVGYAKVSSDGGFVSGTAVFAYTENGVTMYETGVPAGLPTQNFSIFANVENAATDTGLAIVSAEGMGALVSMRLYDSSFNYLAEKTIELGFMSHTAKYATEIFPQLRSLGISTALITFQSEAPVVPLTLRQHRDPAKVFPADVYLLTAFPVIPGTADE